MFTVMSEMSLYHENARELSAAMCSYAVILLCTNWQMGGEKAASVRKFNTLTNLAFRT